MKKLFFAMLLIPFLAHAQNHEDDDDMPHAEYVRKVVVFPIGGPKVLDPVLDAAWWKIRERLTENKKFLVASKRFMSQKNVFQPRKTIKAADVLLLAKLLEANALFSMYLEDRTFYMNVYSGEDGFLLWTKTLTLHPSLPIEQQLEAVADKLILDFLAFIPYQGFHILDPLKDRAVYEENNKQLAKVDVGNDGLVKVGDEVHWISIERLNNEPLYQNGGKLTVIAEGQVVSKDRGILVVDIQRAKNTSELKVNSTVQLPRISELLKKQYLVDASRPHLSPEVVYSPLPPIQTQSDEARPLLSAITSIGSFVLFLILAL